MTAMLLSAAGIAYMASVSYPDELGIRDARLQQHQQSAAQIASAMRQEIDQILLRWTQLSAKELGRRQWDAPGFVISDEGELLFPSTEPLRPQNAHPQEGLLPVRGFRARQRLLSKAGLLEIGACALVQEPCEASYSQRRAAASIYESILSFTDTGAEALLGLARLDRAADKGDLAVGRYRELAERFGSQVNEQGVPYLLLSDIGIAEVSLVAPAAFALLRKIMDRSYDAPNALLEVAAGSAIEALGRFALGQAEQRELEGIEEALRTASADRVFAKRLEARLPELQRSASTEARSMIAPWAPQKNLIYALSRDARVYGVLLSEAGLQELAIKAAPSAGLHASLVPRVQGVDASDEGTRRARVNLGPLLPHLALVLWEQGDGSDGMNDIAEARRRHRAITGGLMVVLVLGLLATIRGAARERELARLKSDFVSTVSHELKTPLTSIRMFAEMLREGVAGDDREKEAHYHGIIVKESERLGLLIANLLDYSQIERGTRRYTDIEATASSIAREAGETFLRLREGEGQELELEIDSEVEGAIVSVDRDVLVQCVLNLLSNAAKYGGDAPIELRVEKAQEEGFVDINVTDQGLGIPHSEQEKIFREFYRAPEAVTSAIEGTGLGLALVKRHVEAQGGTVDVASVVGKGSTFAIQLPVVKS